MVANCIRAGSVVTAGSTPRVEKTYTVTDTDLLRNTVTGQVVSDGSLNIHSNRVVFHSSDLIRDLLSTTSSAPTTSKLTGSTSTPTTASIPIGSHTAAPTALSSGSLSVGATAGIGVGIGVDIFLLLSGMAWLVWRQYKIRQRATRGRGEAELPALEVNVYLSRGAFRRRD